jgi:hypothetical protein
MIGRQFNFFSNCSFVAYLFLLCFSSTLSIVKKKQLCKIAKYFSFATLNAKNNLTDFI